MKRRNLRGWTKWLLAAVFLAAWGCAPALAPGAAVSGPTVVAVTYQDEVMPASTPDPVPDPETGQTEIPGDHLDVIGTITALDNSSIAVDGVIYNLTSTTEIKGSLDVGARVKLEYVINADGSRTVIEAKSSEFSED